MNNDTIIKVRFAERAALVAAGADDRTADVVSDLRWRARQTRLDLVAEAHRLAEHCERVAVNAAEGFTINTLGEVQGRGLDLDRLCVRLGAETEAATMAAWPWVDRAGLDANLWADDTEAVTR